MPRIKVHRKALAHLSRGLYRSPASALRELVSNAWDANATRVTVSTNYPHFLQISIQDNGDGFTKEDFARLMDGGIGNSEKRADDGEEPLRYGRPVIGRLGIGMLGIAQICGSFDVASRPKNGTPFHARVHLWDLIRPKLDSEDPKVVTEENGNILQVDVGTYDFIEDSKNEIREGTRITSGDVHPLFADSFQRTLKLEKFEEPSLKWAECLRVISKVHTLQELGDYWRLLWELAAACPLPYVSSRAVPDGAVVAIQERLESYRFEVVVDGISLAKPVLLRGNVHGYTVEKIPLTEEKVYGRQIKYEGYIAVQEGTQLKPDEMRGVMVRIKNIGVGYYDPRFLDYPWNQGPREKW